MIPLYLRLIDRAISRLSHALQMPEKLNLVSFQEPTTRSLQSDSRQDDCWTALKFLINPKSWHYPRGLTCDAKTSQLSVNSRDVSGRRRVLWHSRPYSAWRPPNRASFLFFRKRRTAAHNTIWKGLPSWSKWSSCGFFLLVVPIRRRAKQGRRPPSRASFLFLRKRRTAAHNTIWKR